MADFDLVVRGRRSKVRHVPAAAPAGAARGAGPRRPVRSKVFLIPAVTPTITPVGGSPRLRCHSNWASLQAGTAPRPRSERQRPLSRGTPLLT